MPCESSSKVTSPEFRFELARRVEAVTPSITLAIAAKAKELRAKGVDVISLSAGEPDFDTPEEIKQAATAALQRGDTKYTPVSGTVELRKAVCAKLARDQQLTFSPDNIVVCTGAKHAIFNVLFALLNDGDEVAIPSPYWLSYPEMVSVLGGRPVFIPTNEETDFKLTPEILKKGISGRTKILILNSPSNPTGAVYSRDELLALAAVLRGYPRLTVISDEIYEKLIFDGQRHYSIASLDPDLASRTIIVNGHSKAYSMTGWRLGWAACPTVRLAKAVGSIQSHSTSNPTSFAQAGGVVALEKGDAEAARMCQVFEKRRNLFFEKLAKIPKLKPFRPQGAFYLFVDISATGLDSVRFSERLLDEAHVAVVPCKPFGSDRHIRTSFATSEKDLEEASKRIAAWIQKL